MATKQEQASPDDEVMSNDPVIKMIKNTGCLSTHYEVQECMAEKQDWRYCQEEVQAFKKCMSSYEERRFADKYAS